MSKIPSRSDFGDDETTGLYVRRLDYVYCSANDSAYGVYLGEINGKWCIGTMARLEMKPTSIIEYNSLEALKKDWELD